MRSYRNATGSGKVESSHVSHRGTKCCMQTEIAPDLFPYSFFSVAGETEA